MNYQVASKPYIIFLLLAGLICMLPGCTTIEVARGQGLETQTTIDHPYITQTLSVVKRSSPTPLNTQTPVPSTPQSTPSPSITFEVSIIPATLIVSQTTIPAVKICSPLNDFPLEKLPKIVSDPYDPPPMGSDDRHQGVDFVYHRLAGIEIPILGVQVNSVLPGFVAGSIEESFPYGNLVIVETPGSWMPKEWLDVLGMTAEQSLYLLYAHLQEKPMVNLGDSVISCQPIGKVGNSGNTEAAHLHLETRIGPGGGRFPSMYGLLQDAPEEARKNYNLWRKSGVFLHFDPMLLFLELK